MSYDFTNQTGLIPQQLFSLTENGSQSINVSNTGITLCGDLLTTPIIANISQLGIVTDNPTGFDILSPLNMNSNAITNVDTISSTDGYNMIITSTNDFNLQSVSVMNLNVSNGSLNLTSSSGEIALSTDQQITLKAGTGMNFITPVGIWISGSSPNVGDGSLYANFYGSLNGTATNATTAALATTITTTNTNVSSNYYLNFSNSSSTGNGSVLKTAGISVNPSTNIITATSFTGNLTGTATNATNASITSDNTNGTYYIPFTKTSGTGNKQLFQDDLTGPLTYNPSTGNVSAIYFSANSYTITGIPSTADVAGKFGQIGLVYLSTASFSITGSASSTNFNLAGIFNSTYKNYRIVLTPNAQLTFSAYPSYSLTAFLGSGTMPTSASLYGFEVTASSLVAPVYTAGAIISSAPLVLAVSQLVNHQTIIEVENVGYTTSVATQQVGLKCKSFYSNLSQNGASDRSILAIAAASSTITGLTLQQSSISVGNNMVLDAIIYGYNLT